MLSPKSKPWHGLSEHSLNPEKVQIGLFQSLGNVQSSKFSLEPFNILGPGAGKESALVPAVEGEFAAVIVDEGLA